MAWIKLDDQFPDHPKVDGLSDGAFRLHVSGLCHAGRYLTDGFLDADRPMRLMRRYKSAYLRELLDGGIWLAVDSGYQIYEFTTYQKSRQWWEEKREKDAKRLAEWRAEQAAKQEEKRDE